MRLNEQKVLEAQLVDAARLGDPESFRLLFDRYYAMIYAFAYRVCLVETEADDIAQETFIRVARGFSNYRGAASFKNWVYCIANNVLVDWRRQSIRNRDKQAQFAAELESRAQSHAPDPADVPTSIAAVTPTIGEVAQSKAALVDEYINKVTAAETASEKANMLVMNGDVDGAWETIELAVKDWPDDMKLNKLLASLSERSADFVSALDKARDAEAKKELGCSLTWYVNAQSHYPASQLANDGIDRISKRILLPQSAESAPSPAAEVNSAFRRRRVCNEGSVSNSQFNTVFLPRTRSVVGAGWQG